MIVAIKFQDDPLAHPLVVYGTLEFIEHVAREWGDMNGFVPDRRLEIDSRSKVITYSGTLTKTGHGAIMEIIEIEPVHEDDDNFYTRNADEWKPYIIDEEFCEREDWTNGDDLRED